MLEYAFVLKTLSFTRSLPFSKLAYAEKRLTFTWIDPRKKSVFRVSVDCETCSRTAPPSTRRFQVKVSPTSVNRWVCGSRLLFSFMSM